MTQILFLASDHAGIDLKASLKEEAEKLGWDVRDLGPTTPDSVDYPAYAQKVTTALLAEKEARGLLICGSGIGMSIAANRVHSIRAALCHDVTSAQLARRHNDANVLCLGARMIGLAVAKDCLNAFLTTAFEGGRHQKRIDLLG